MPRAYLGLGANLGQPDAQIESAFSRIAGTPGIELVARSRLYRSAPIGPAGQPDYCNAAGVIDLSLDPLALLETLQRIENDAGRERHAGRWTARTLDLDILHIDGLACTTAALTLPHPELARRAFVLLPLAELAPLLLIPGLDRIDRLASAIDRRGLSFWH